MAAFTDEILMAYADGALDAEGSVLGVGMSYGARGLIRVFAPQMITAIVPDWWPIATAISIVGALAGALYPGLRAARHDVVEALAYE